MSSAVPDTRFAFFKSIQFRQGLVFTLTISLFSIFLYFWVVYSIYQEQVSEELTFLNHKLIGYYAYYQTENINIFINHVRQDIYEDSRNKYFIRLVNASEEEIYSYYPTDWYRFDFSLLLEPGGLTKEYVQLYGPEKDYLLLATQINFYDGAYIQGGISTETRQALFSLYKNSYGTILPLILLLSFLVGTLTTSHALSPLKALNIRIQDITRTADVSMRLNRSYSGDQLDLLTERINQLLERIVELIDELKGSMDSAAHDLRTPLTRMSGRAEVALRNPDISKMELKEVLTNTILDSQEILKIFNTLMSISESEKKLEQEQEIFSIHDVLEDIVDLYSLIAEEKDVQIELDLGDLQRAYRGSLLRLKQALSNLVDNAVKYSDPGETVRIHMTGGRGGITLEIVNQGIPIAEDEISKIWNRFYRSDKSRSSDGLGLGLSLVKAVVEAHQGSIQVQSSADGLTRFTINLPYLQF